MTEASFATGLFLGMTVGFMGGIGAMVGILALGVYLFRQWAERQ